MKYFCVAKLNGQFDKFIKLLNSSEYDSNNKNHKLVFCGNMLDGGPKQIELMRYIKEKIKKNKAIAVRGNSEDFHILRPYYIDDNAILECKKLGLDENTAELEMRRFAISLPHYVETLNHIFVSAGINPNLKDWRSGMKSAYNWCDSMTWMFNDQLIRVKNGAFNNFNKKVVCGFGSCATYHFFMKNNDVPYYNNEPDKKLFNIPFEVKNFVNIDGCWEKEHTKGIIYTTEE